MKLTKITLDPYSDSYYILFVDENKFDEGDDYHTKLSYKIEGIQEFLTFTKTKFSFEEIKLENDGEGYYEFDYQPEENEKLDAYLNRLKRTGFKIVN